MLDSYYKRCRQVAQLETVNTELQIKCLSMAKYLYSGKHEDKLKAMQVAFEVLGIKTPKQLNLKAVA